VFTAEAVTERLIEIDEEPPLPPPEPGRTAPEAATPALAAPLAAPSGAPATAPAAASSPATPASTPPPALTNWDEEYLPANKISDNPEFPVDQIRDALVYPPLSKQAGIEGRVILDLFVDRQGIIRRVDVIAEQPPGRGFGEAAKAAFEGIICKPARANGQDVSARIRYPVSFRLR
jgi:protein TonB